MPDTPPKEAFLTAGEKRITDAEARVRADSLKVQRSADKAQIIAHCLDLRDSRDNLLATTLAEAVSGHVTERRLNRAVQTAEKADSLDACNTVKLPPRGKSGKLEI